MFAAGQRAEVNQADFYHHRAMTPGTAQNHFGDLDDGMIVASCKVPRRR